MSEKSEDAKTVAKAQARGSSDGCSSGTTIHPRRTHLSFSRSASSRRHRTPGPRTLPVDRDEPPESAPFVEDLTAILDVPVTAAAPIEAIRDPESIVEIGMPARSQDEPPGGAKSSWWSRLREGLSWSSSSIGTGIGDIFTKRKLDAAMLEDLEDVLIRADLGVATATRISQAVGKGRYDKSVSPDDVKAILAG